MPKTIVVSYSEIDAIRQCGHKHDLSYRARWTKPPAEGSPLARGSLWHLVMENHYRTLMTTARERQQFGQGMPTADEMMRSVVGLLYDHNMRQTEDQQLIEWIYHGYLEAWGFDHDWEIRAVEHPAEVWLPTDRGGRSRFKLKMKIDLVVRDRNTNKIWLVDHKSCKNLPYQKDLDIDDQFGLYTWGLRQLGHPVFGSYHNAARTHRPKVGGPDDLRPRDEQGRYLNADGVTVSKNQPKPYPLEERFSRTPMSRTDVELDTIAVEAYKTVKAAYARPEGYAPRSPDPDRCGWRCDYTEACLAGRKGVDEVEVLLGTGYVQGFDPITGAKIRH